MDAFAESFGRLSIGAQNGTNSSATNNDSGYGGSSSPAMHRWLAEQTWEEHYHGQEQRGEGSPQGKVQMVNPRSVEYGPNPVIERHLIDQAIPETGSGNHETGIAAHRTDSESSDPPENSTETVIEIGPCQQGMNPASGSHSGPARDLVGNTAPAIAERAVEALLKKRNKKRKADDAMTPDTPFQCQDCPEAFETEGQRTDHRNRKHVRRFSCPIWQLSFNLRADLERHKKTVHKNANASTETFQCTNEGCNDPKKQYIRKDNFKRHVQRCQRRLVKLKRKLAP